MERLRGTCISIHASAREATSARLPLRPVRSIFQSTPPRGRRPLVELGTLNGFTISIHASAREATVLHCDNADCPANFNPHLREGGDAAIRSDSKSPPPFQSTPPRGRRHWHNMTPYSVHIFQSTPPRGRRHGRLGRCVLERSISIHASAREATRQRSTIKSVIVISIHASAREATMHA